MWCDRLLKKKFHSLGLLSSAPVMWAHPPPPLPVYCLSSCDKPTLIGSLIGLRITMETHFWTGLCELF